MLLATAVRGAADAAGSAVKLNSSFGSCPLQWSPFTPSPAASFSSSTDVSRGAAWCSPGTHTWAPGGGSHRAGRLLCDNCLHACTISCTKMLKKKKTLFSLLSSSKLRYRQKRFQISSGKRRRASGPQHQVQCAPEELTCCYGCV